MDQRKKLNIIKKVVFQEKKSNDKTNNKTNDKSQYDKTSYDKTSYDKTSYDCIVLSGGGIKGLIQLGYLSKCIEDEILNLDNIIYYSGVSVGSIISILLCLGYTPTEIFGQLQGISKFVDTPSNIIDFPTKMGLFNMSKILGIITELIDKKMKEKYGFSCILTFKQLYKLTGKTVYVTVCNLSKMRKEVISHYTNPDMPIIIALRMSCNVPLIFEKMIYEDQYFVDGGIVDNFPITAIPEWKTKKILGVIVHGSMPETTITPINYFHRLVLLPINAITNLGYELADTKNAHIKKIQYDGVPLIDFEITDALKTELFSFGFNVK